MPVLPALALLALVAAHSAGPAQAQVVCRSNALGTEVCTGVPSPAMRRREVEPRAGRGLSGVQSRPQTDAAPRLVPGRKLSPLGATILEPTDLPPRRSPLPGVSGTTNCKRDALGNLVCS